MLALLQPFTERGSTSHRLSDSQAQEVLGSAREAVDNTQVLDSGAWQPVRKRRGSQSRQGSRPALPSCNGYTWSEDQVDSDFWALGFGNPLRANEFQHSTEFAQNTWGKCARPTQPSSFGKRQASGGTRPGRAESWRWENRFSCLTEPDAEPDADPSQVTFETGLGDEQQSSPGPRGSALSGLDMAKQNKTGHSKRKTKLKTKDGHPDLQMWTELSQILEGDFVCPMISREADLVAWAEKYEARIPAGSLGRWIIEHMMTLLARGEDDTEAIKVALHQLMAQPMEHTGLAELQILQANVTSYRTEIKKWAVQQEAQVVCLQETHIIPANDAAVKAGFSTMGKQVNTVPAAVTQGEVRQGSQGGLMMLASNHVNLRRLDSWDTAGKGYQLGILRLKGFDLCIGNVYLESGVGPTQGVNPEILTRLSAAVVDLGVSFLITRDWNCQPEDLSSVLFPDRVGGRVLFPTEPTISTGGTLDFAVCHPRLVAITDCVVDWNTPFKPHAAVLYRLSIRDAQLPVLQAPAFPKGVLDEPVELPRPPNPAKCVMLLEQDTRQPHDLAWGGFMQWLEASVCEGGAQGRGSAVKCTVAPLLPTQAPLPSWKGAVPAYWTRVQTWVKAYGRNTLHVRVRKILLTALESSDYDYELEGVDMPAFRAILHTAVAANRQLLDSHSSQLDRIADEAGKRS